MKTNTLKNVELLAVPFKLFHNIRSGCFKNILRLKRIIGMKCRAPYTGNIHVKTDTKRSTST